jgi:hypothetical protein
MATKNADCSWRSVTVEGIKSAPFQFLFQLDFEKEFEAYGTREEGENEK